MKLLRLLLVLLTPMLLFLGCSKEKSFEVGSGSSTAQWEFTEGSNFFKGTIDTAYKVEVAAGITGLLLEGTSDDGTGQLTLGVIGINPTAPGTYQSPNVLFDYTKQSGTIYENDITAVGQFTVEITSISATSVSGTFTGKAKDSVGALKTITSGKFSAKLGAGAPAGQAQIMFWAKTGCGSGTGPISVKLSDGQTGSITAFPATAPGCGAASTATFVVPAGTYGYEAICAGDTLRGVVTAIANQCLTSELRFSTGPAAQYSLAGAPNACSSSQINGTYFAGKPLSADTNTVVVQVNVTQVGSYTISTNALNGYSFSASGTFTNTGTQPVTLKSSGTPSVVGTNNFTVTAGSSSCTFSISVVALPPGASTNSYSFTEGGKNYSGVWEGPGIFDDDIFGFGKALYLFGGVPNTDTVVDLYIQFPASATEPIPGTYITDPDVNSTNTSAWFMYNINTQADYYYTKTTVTPPPDVKLTIVITSYDAVTKIVKGTFSGKAFNGAGQAVNITNGKFEGEVEF